jgi:hypothetical protein
MMIIHPGLGRQIFQIDPHGRSGHARHRLKLRIGHTASKRFDDEISRLMGGGGVGGGVGRGVVPNTHGKAIQRLGRRLRLQTRAKRRQPRQIIDPQSHRQLVLRKRARQTPANAGIAIVVDHLAIDIDRIDFRHRSGFRGKVHRAAGMLIKKEPLWRA